jgi:hypothetical protein
MTAPSNHVRDGAILLIDDDELIVGSPAVLNAAAADGGAVVLMKPQPITSLSQFIAGAIAPLQMPPIKG